MEDSSAPKQRHALSYHSKAAGRVRVCIPRPGKPAAPDRSPLVTPSRVCEKSVRDLRVRTAGLRADGSPDPDPFHWHPSVFLTCGPEWRRMKAEGRSNQQQRKKRGFLTT